MAGTESTNDKAATRQNMVLNRHWGINSNKMIGQPEIIAVNADINARNAKSFSVLFCFYCRIH